MVDERPFVVAMSTYGVPPGAFRLLHCSGGRFDQLTAPVLAVPGAGALWDIIEPNFVTGCDQRPNRKVAGIDWNTNRGYSNYSCGVHHHRNERTHGLTLT